MHNDSGALVKHFPLMARLPNCRTGSEVLLIVKVFLIDSDEVFQCLSLILSVMDRLSRKQLHQVDDALAQANPHNEQRDIIVDG